MGDSHLRINEKLSIARRVRSPSESLYLDRTDPMTDTTVHIHRESILTAPGNHHAHTLLKYLDHEVGRALLLSMRMHVVEDITWGPVEALRKHTLSIYPRVRDGAPNVPLLRVEYSNAALTTDERRTMHDLMPPHQAMDLETPFGATPLDRSITYAPFPAPTQDEEMSQVSVVPFPLDVFLHNDPDFPEADRKAAYLRTLRLILDQARSPIEVPGFGALRHAFSVRIARNPTTPVAHGQIDWRGVSREDSIRLRLAFLGMSFDESLFMSTATVGQA
jgi:hypothetical protein